MRSEAGPRCPYLRLGEAEGRGQLHPLGCGQVPLDLEALLQAGELRVGEHGAGFAAAAMLPGQLGVSVVLEKRWHRHSWGTQGGHGGVKSPRDVGLSPRRLGVGSPSASLIFCLFVIFSFISFWMSIDWFGFWGVRCADFHPGKVKGARAPLPPEGTRGWRRHLNPPGDETTTKRAWKKPGEPWKRLGWEKRSCTAPLTHGLGNFGGFLLESKERARERAEPQDEGEERGKRSQLGQREGKARLSVAK